MTLDSFLRLQQEQYENVIVVETDFIVNPEDRLLEPVARLIATHHPIAPDSLKMLRHLWTLQYRQWQASQNRRVHNMESLNRSTGNKRAWVRRKQRAALGIVANRSHSNP